MDKNKDLVLVTGGSGLVGSAVIRALKVQGWSHQILSPSHRVCDLTQPLLVNEYFKRWKISHVIHCAGRVGGILANSQNQVEFLYDNSMMAMNVISAAAETDVKQLIFLGSSCIYPRAAGVDKDIKESDLLTGPLEKTNEGYAIAKIAGLKLCEFYRSRGKDFITAMPCNLYGPGDRFHPENSHVIPALIQRFQDAKINKKRKVTIWGSGRPIREFLHVDDLARALLLLMEKGTEHSIVNIGSECGVTITRLAHLIRDAVAYRGDIEFDASKPDGTYVKVMDSSRIRAMGWAHHILLEQGLRDTYEWALKAVFGNTCE